MEKTQDSDHAVVVACTEVLDFVKLTEFIKCLWKVEVTKVVLDSAPERVFSEEEDRNVRDRLRKSIDASLQNQSMKRLAIVAHSGCKMSIVSHEVQMEMLRKSVDYLIAQYPDTRIVGIWVDKTGTPLRVDL